MRSLPQRMRFPCTSGNHPSGSLPYSDISDLTPEELAAKQARGEALVFGHSLAEQIGGQLEAGFMLAGFYEDVCACKY